MKFSEFGDYLKEKREKAGLSQTEVSTKFGYTSPQFISNIERGIARPPTEILPKLIKLYGLEREDLLDHYILTTRRLLESELGLKPLKPRRTK
jgi:transcriptional regulator with XRE-family HTH domain